MLLFHGLMSGGYSIGAWRLASQSRDWPVAEALIENSSFIEHDRVLRPNRFFPMVHYRYVAQGEEHLGGRIWFGLRRKPISRRWANRLAEEFPPGAMVQIRYDPDLSARSALMSARAPGLWATLIKSLLTCAVGGLFIWIAGIIWTETKEGSKTSEENGEIPADPIKSERGALLLISPILLIVLVIGLFASLFFGLPLIAMDIVDTSRGNASLIWPQTQGEIVEIDDILVEAKGGPKLNRVIHYRYTLEDREYSATTVRFRAPVDPFYSPWEWNSLLQRYEVGNLVPVHYNSKNQGSVTLEPGPTRPNLVHWALIWFGVCSVVSVSVAALASAIGLGVDFIRLGRAYLR